LTGRRARFAVPARSAIRCARSALRCAVACTPANASSSATTLPESRCTLARALPVLRRRAEGWSRGRSPTPWPAPHSPSQNGARPCSKACQTRGIYSGQSRAESSRAYSAAGETAASLELHAGREHDRPPFGLFRLHEGGELIGRGRGRRGVLAVELLFQLGG